MGIGVMQIPITSGAAIRPAAETTHSVGFAGKLIAAVCGVRLRARIERAFMKFGLILVRRAI